MGRWGPITEHPYGCAPSCVECARDDALRDLHDTYECERPRVAVLPARDRAGDEVWVPCGTCERCRTGEPQ